jgi:hypothetical protein
VDARVQALIAVLSDRDADGKNLDLLLHGFLPALDFHW